MTDFNDLHQSHGAKAVQDAINAAVPVGVLDKKPKKQTQADQLVSIAAESELFYTPDKKAYADIKMNNHRETWPVRSKVFKRWLIGRFYKENDKAPNSEALNNALNTVEAMACCDGLEREVFIRVAEHDGNLYLDLCCDDWRVVEISPDGCSHIQI